MRINRDARKVAFVLFSTCESLPDVCIHKVFKKHLRGMEIPNKNLNFQLRLRLSIRRLCYDLMEYDTLHSIGCTLHNYGVRGLQVITSFNHVQTLCNPMGCSLPGSFVYGILQARIMEWVAISFLTQGLNQGLLNCRQILYPLSHWGSLSNITVHVNIIS